MIGSEQHCADRQGIEVYSPRYLSASIAEGKLDGKYASRRNPALLRRL